MAVVISQKPGGLVITFDRGKWSGTSTYVIVDDAGASMTPSDVWNAVVVQTKLGPTEFSGGSGALTDLGTYFTTGPRMRQVAADIRQVDDGGYVYEGTVTFDSNLGSGSTQLPDRPNETQEAFTAIEYSVQGEPVDVWRVGATIPSGSGSDNPADTDIGGTKVDAGGEPITSFVNIARVTVRNVNVGRPTPPLSQVNTRNNANFSIGPFSFPDRSLLFTGVQISRVATSTYETVYSFAYDADLHLRQIASKSPHTQSVILGAKSDTCTGTPTSADQGFALCVYLRQPFPATSSFSSLNMTT